MDELKKLLEYVYDSYPDFVTGVMLEIKERPKRLDDLIAFIKSHPSASTSDIAEWTTINVLGIDPDNPPELILVDDEELEED